MAKKICLNSDNFLSSHLAVNVWKPVDGGAFQHLLITLRESVPTPDQIRARNVCFV